MAGPSLGDDMSFRFRQYKDDTEYIAGWLAETSLKYGYSLQSKKVSKRKPKNKKDGGGGGTSKALKYIIQVSNFVPMAELIAQQPSKTPVPGYLDIVFDRVIEARRAVSAFWQRTKKDKESDKRHLHFIEILETTFSILRPFTEVKTRKSTARFTSTNGGLTLQQITNSFATLDVEEPGETEDGTTNEIIEEEMIPKVAPVIIQKTETEIEDDFFFAIDLFLYELHDIQRLVNEEWQLYNQSKVDLVVPSLITNVAIDLVRQAENDFEQVLVRPARFPASKFPVWTLPALRYSCQYRDFPTLNIEDYVKPSKYTLGYNMSGCGFCFYPVFVGLKSFVYHTSEATFPNIDTRQFGREAPEDLIRTLDMAFIYCIGIETYLSAQPTHDEITRGILYMIKKREVPLWVTFSMQMLLDIQKRLGNSTGKALTELQRHVEACYGPEQPLDRPCEHETGLEAQEEEVCEQRDIIAKQLKLVNGPDKWRDILRTQSMIKDHSILSHVVSEEFFFFKRQPILCGLMKYRLYNEELRYRLGLEDLYQDMCFLAHVYTAGQITTPGARSWPDMEFVLYRQDPEYIFHGGKPTDIEQAEAKLMLTCGSSVTNSARDRRTQGRPAMNMKNVRRFRIPNQFMMEIFFNRMNYCGPTVETIGTAKDTLVPTLVQAMNSPENQRRLLRQLNMPAGAQLRGGTSRTPRAFEVLGSLHTWLQADLVDLLSDWRSFQRLCNDMWKDILAALRPDPEWQQTKFVKNGRRTPMMATAELLRLAVNAERNIHDRRIPNATVAMQLHTAWNAMQQSIHGEQKKPGSENQFWAGDSCLRQLVSVPAMPAFFARPQGPAHLAKLFKNYSKKQYSDSGTIAYVAEKLINAKREDDQRGVHNPLNIKTLELIRQMWV